jgi:hypothetical protein
MTSSITITLLLLLLLLTMPNAHTTNFQVKEECQDVVSLFLESNPPGAILPHHDPGEPQLHVDEMMMMMTTTTVMMIMMMMMMMMIFMLVLHGPLHGTRIHSSRR